jgi:alpha-mannosidase
MVIMMKEKKLHMIGNAHLDPVWLWNWQEGFQEVKATFRSALDRMKEDEQFIFSCSSAAFYEWVEKNNPKMFEEIVTRVEEGRWEIVGGWFVQPDCNIPGGEALVRHGLYSQRYFLKKFKKMAKTGYNVDSFGHNGMLPQILAKSGMENYVFMRPMPLEKGLPGRVFWWRSEDGSKVLTYRIPYEYCTSGKDLEYHANRLNYELRDGEDELMMFYGVGNHGGGPTKENIRSIHELNSRENMPVCEMSSTEAFFDSIRNNQKEYASVFGDLQHHASGCYSVHSGIKRGNRKAEIMLINAEKWSTVSRRVENQPYPEDFEQAWKGVLFNQFHDILAGTSIPSAYEDASYLYGEAMAIGQRNLNYAIQAISWDINIEMDVTMKPIVVFNSHSWSGKMAVELEVRGLSSDNFRLEDEKGNIIPAQRVRSEATVNGQSRLLFTAELPSLGYRLFKLFLKTEEELVLPPVPITASTVENERYKLEFNLETGCLKSFYDKKCDLEILRREGARLAVVEDKSDTWSHNIYKFDKELGNMEVVSVRIFEEGPVRSTMCVKSKYQDSYVLQYFRVYQELDYIEVKMKVDWREPQTMLKLKFPVNFNFRKPTYEMPYGYIEKSANGEEEPGQTWIDFSGEHFKNGMLYGLGIANDSKYSYSFDVDEMAVTILKNSVYAHHDPKKLEAEEDYHYVDHGVQELTYALIPHEGGWKDSNLLQRSMEINQRPICVIETFHEGSQPQVQTFAEVDKKEIILSVLKEAEDKDGVILRAYETMKHKVTATVKLPFMEREFTLSFGPCEIKTVKIPYDSNLPAVEVNMLEL